MIRVLTVVASVCVWSVCAMAQPASLEGEAAPEVALETLGGEAVELAEHEGERPVLLTFWNSAGSDVGMLIMLNAMSRDVRGLAVYGVHVGGDEEGVRAAVERFGLERLEMLIDRDRDAAESFGVRDTPVIVMIDKEGVVFGTLQGFGRDFVLLLRRDLDALMRGAERPGPLEEIVAGAGMAALAAERLDRRGYLAVGVRDYGASAVFLLSGGGVEIHRAGGVVSFDRASRTYFGHPPVLTVRDGETEVVLPSRMDQEMRLLNEGADVERTIPIGAGINEAAGADFDGDGDDEWVVGLNGSAGILMYDGTERVWRIDGPRNVWTTDAGDVMGDARPEIVSTGARG